ncbi:MAG: periplasmic heavy metal sensor [Hyphomonadaceae bacterium]|nr:periplasmic heavy metal sensor [Hyphomonadaceae bacterium]
MSKSSSSFPFALTASVLINLLLVGLVVGYLVGKGPERERGARDGPPPGPMRSEYMLARGIVDLGPPEDRRALIGMFRDIVLDSGPDLRRRVAARTALSEAVGRDPYDPEVVRAAMDELQAIDRELQSAFQDAIVARLGELTPEQRQHLQQAMQRDRWRPERFRERRELQRSPQPEE